MTSGPVHVPLVRAFSLVTISLGTLVSITWRAEEVPVDARQDTVAVDAALEGYAPPIVAPADATYAFETANIKVAVPVVSSRSSRGVVSHPPPPRLDPDAVMAEASKYIGTPYKAGGSTPKGFDCSGFVSYVFAKLGVTAPRSSSSYWTYGVRIAAKDAKPGDILLLPGHVGIYAGHGMQIDAPHQGLTVQIRPMWKSKSYIYIRVP